MKKHASWILLGLALVVILCGQIRPIVAIPVGSVTYTDPAGDVYQGTTTDYLGDWDIVSDPAVDLLSIMVGDGMTTGELTLGVTGGLTSLAVDDNLAYSVSINTTADTYQMIMIIYQGGTWSCVMLAVWAGVSTIDTPAVVITDVAISVVGHNTFLDYEDGTVAAFAVRYVSLSPPVFDVDFFPDSVFLANAPPGTPLPGTLPFDLTWLWILLAVIAVVIIIVIILVTRTGGNENKKNTKKTQTNRRERNGRK
jgi:hypothetical protein